MPIQEIEREELEKDLTKMIDEELRNFVSQIEQEFNKNYGLFMQALGLGKLICTADILNVKVLSARQIF